MQLEDSQQSMWQPWQCFSGREGGGERGEAWRQLYQMFVPHNFYCDACICSPLGWQLQARGPGHIEQDATARPCLTIHDTYAAAQNRCLCTMRLGVC